MCLPGEEHVKGIEEAIKKAAVDALGLETPSPEYLAFIRDRALHGDYAKGMYRGHIWYAIRNHSRVWCGYITLDVTALADRDSLERVAHGGITGGDGVVSLGFDCGHGYYPSEEDEAPDYIPGSASEGDCGTYRDLEYVKRTCMRMIYEVVVQRSVKVHVR
jgi:hypothetical protein